MLRFHFHFVSLQNRYTYFSSGYGRSLSRVIKHEHEHAQGHEHEHAQGHEHEHEHEHEQGHEHEHEHEHEQGHGDTPVLML